MVGLREAKPGDEGGGAKRCPAWGGRVVGLREAKPGGRVVVLRDAKLYPYTC